MIRSRRIFFFNISLIVLAAFLWAPSARGQSLGDALTLTRHAPASGARMMGLAGAGAGGLDDYSALVYNPAALGFFQHSEVAGAFYGFSASDDAAYQLPGGGASTSDEGARNYGLGNLAYIYKAPTTKGSLVLGGAINRVSNYARKLSYQGINTRNAFAQSYIPDRGQFSLEAERGEDGQFGTADDAFIASFDSPFARLLYDTYALDLAYDDIDVGSSGNVSWRGDSPFRSLLSRVQQDGQITEEGSLYEANLGGAFEAGPNVMIGASVNIQFGSYENTRIYHEENQVDEEDLIDFEQLELTDRFQDDLTGANGRLGLSARIIKGLRGGLMLESPTYYDVEENYSKELYAQSEEVADTYGDDANETIGSDELSYQIITPWQFSGGLAYTVGRASLSGDLTFVDWSQLSFDSDDVTDGTYEDLSARAEENLDIALNARFGGEYRFDRFSLRAGFAYEPDPFQADFTDADGSTFDSKRLYYSAGVGFKLSRRLNLDASWMQERFKDQHTPYIPNEGTAPFVNEDVARNRFVVGLRYAF